MESCPSPKFRRAGFILLFWMGCISGCFITNCPPGGKRTGPPTPETDYRQCELCGPPRSEGRCYGPSICCSPEFGCLMGTVETISCNLESRFTIPCKNPGSPCSGNGKMGTSNGQCASDGICCNSEMCTTDENCVDDGGVESSTMVDELHPSIVFEGLRPPPSASSGGIKHYTSYSQGGANFEHQPIIKEPSPRMRFYQQLLRGDSKGE